MSISNLNNDDYDRGWMDAIDSAEVRIEDLEAEVERLRKALANLIQYGDRIVAHQALTGEY